MKAGPKLVEQPLPLRARIAGGLTTAGMLVYTSSLIQTGITVGEGSSSVLGVGYRPASWSDQENGGCERSG